MIDLHTHVLPNLDDGSKDTEESIEMLRDSMKQGVTHVVATPHCVVHRDEDILSFLEARQKSFNEIPADNNIPEILLGAEIYFDNDLSEYEDINKLCIGDTNYILVEFPMGKHNVSQLAEWLYALTLKGLKPIVAHIDRYPDFEELINAFDVMDIVYQINASRFIEFLGRRMLKKILSKVDFAVVSSDMHNTGFRKSHMQLAYEKACRIIPERADDLFCNNAEEILFKEKSE